MEKLFEKKAGTSFNVLLSLLLLMGLSAFTAQQAPRQGKVNASSAMLQLTVEGLRSNQGVVRIALFNNEEGFPDNNQKALKVLAIVPKGGKAHAALGPLPAGTYAIALLHDENENGKMDTNLVGYPKEGWGASADELPVFRAPRFQEAAFELKGVPQSLALRIRY